jgi:electron transport complex protein RnfG
VRGIIRMIVVLTVIGAASGLTLSAISGATRAPIEYQSIKFVKEPAVKKVLTGYDNDPILERTTITVGTDEQGKGFHGTIGVMVGVSKEDEITEEAFTSRFKGQPITGEIQVDGISGATYSSKGVMSAVNEAVGHVTKFKQELF